MGSLRLVVGSALVGLMACGCESDGSGAGTQADAQSDVAAGADAAADASAEADAAEQPEAGTDGDAEPDATTLPDAGEDGSDAGDGDSADAALPCPSGVPGADSDGDGTSDDADCLPCDPNVHPNVTAWQSTARSDGSWDWNCDGAEELEYPTTGKCVYPGCTLQQGFYKVPPCGGMGSKIAYCITNQYSCGTQYESSGASQQRCR